MVARRGARYVAVTMGKIAGVAMGLGVAGAMGSVLLFATAMPPIDESRGEERARIMKGFDEATDHRYNAAAKGRQAAAPAPGNRQ